MVANGFFGSADDGCLKEFTYDAKAPRDQRLSSGACRNYQGRTQKSAEATKRNHLRLGETPLPLLLLSLQASR
jgi:hypothetical protein